MTTVDAKAATDGESGLSSKLNTDKEQTTWWKQRE